MSDLDETELRPADFDETVLRQVARELRGSLLSVVNGDEKLGALIAAEIDGALGGPTSLAKLRLLKAILHDARVHSWVLARLERTPVHVIRLGAPSDGVGEIRDGDLMGGPEATSRDLPSQDSSKHTGQPSAVRRPRYLMAEMAERVETNRPVSLLVSITKQGQAASALKSFEVPAAGATITVVVSSPGLIPRGDSEADIEVPPDADSDPHRFAFMAGPVGVHDVRVEAYRSGTYLGTVKLQLMVEANATAAGTRVRTAELSSVAFEPGEVTLQVRGGGPDGEYQFQLLGDVLYPNVTWPMGDTTSVVSAMLAELKEMAANRSQFENAEHVRDRLKAHGVNLWQAAVPEAVQGQFWNLAGRIKMLTIAADHDTIPWELLFPMNGNDENGFLAEQFPVVRRAYQQRRVTALPMDSVAYVVPPGSPANAKAEVDSLQQQFGTRISSRGIFSSLSAVKNLISASPGVLHFACHNAFSDVVGSSIKLEEGPWAPIDLAVAVQQRALADAGPLVFLNACRTAGEVEWLSRMTGWAEAFMGAGAGAFIGSLWAVRSSTAQTFAQSFYEHFVDGGKPLGESSLLARKAIQADGGDPTWLAYTIYGNPAAISAPEGVKTS